MFSFNFTLYELCDDYKRTLYVYVCVLMLLQYYVDCMAKITNEESNWNDNVEGDAVGAVVVVELPQAPEDDPQKR